MSQDRTLLFLRELGKRAEELEPAFFVSLHLKSDGVYLHVIRGSDKKHASFMVSWLDLEQVRFNPLVERLNQVVQALPPRLSHLP